MLAIRLLHSLLSKLILVKLLRRRWNAITALLTAQEVFVALSMRAGERRGLTGLLRGEILL